MDYQITVPQNLKMLRIKHNLSFAALSKETGLAKSTLQSLEKTCSHNLDTLQILANFYQVPLSALFEDNYMQHPDLLFSLLQSNDWFFRLSPEDQQQLVDATKEYLDLLVRLSDKIR